jgi:hypothetical protein
MIFRCEDAEKSGNLCFGYTDYDEPCAICKLCIKCVSGYYQLGEVPEELKKENENVS